MAVFGRPVCNSVVTSVNCKTGRREWIFVESQRPSLLCGVCCQGSVDLRPHGSLRAWRVMWLYCFSEQEATDSRDAKEPSCAQAQEREVHLNYRLCGFMGESLSSAYNSHCISSIVSSTGRILLMLTVRIS